MKIINPRDIKISNYNYNLPESKIAIYPLVKRDDSKLLVYRDGSVEDKQFVDIANFLPNNSLIIFNNTKVIHARLKFTKSTGASIEIFCLEPYVPHDYATILNSRKSCVWRCMIGNAKKWKAGDLTKILELDDSKIIVTAKKLDIESGGLVEFEWDNDDFSFAELLDIMGELPIPPYLNRKTECSDNERYQTLYSKIEGSVAAPTAGLHFTNEVFNNIEKNNCTIDEVTLHVGAGTFKPVKTDTISGHEMHSEFISIKRKTIENLLKHDGKIVAVGTTSVRTLESLFYIGCLIGEEYSLREFNVSQWLPYDAIESENVSKQKALQCILNYLDKNNLNTLIADTQIMIVPGYTFKIVDAIVTNFHQPKSTLLLLVSAFTKGNWKSIYNHALTHEYRFLSYGDSSLLL